MEKPHVLIFEKNTLTIKGVEKVLEVDEREGQFKLSNSTLVVKGAGLNIVKLDKTDGIVLLEVQNIVSITYKNGLNLKGLFK